MPLGCGSPPGSVVVFPRTWSHCRAARPAGVGAEGEHDETRQDGVGRRASGCQPLREFAENPALRRVFGPSRQAAGLLGIAGGSPSAVGAAGTNARQYPQHAVRRFVGDARHRTKEDRLAWCCCWPGPPTPIPPNCRPTSSACRTAQPRQADAVGADASVNGFDPAAVSEVSWAQWRASVVRHGLAGETPRPLRSQPAKHDPRRLEYSAGRLHRFHLGRNPRHEDARRETGRRHPRGVLTSSIRLWPAWARAITSPCGSFRA